MLRRYTFKLYPNKAQQTALREQARMCAMLWNALLEMRETHYRRAKLRGEKKTSLTAFDQGKDITALNAAAKIDADLSEWRAIPRGTQERVADMLDLAMKAFFKRAKGGAGASSGYPRYKSTRHAENIPLREPVKSCWKFEPKGPDGECLSDALSAKGKRKHSTNSGVSTRPGVEPLKKGGDDRSGELQGGEAVGVEPLKKGDKGSLQWFLTLRGVPGHVKARGKFPITPDAMKTADIKFHDNAWWFSVCVEIPARRVAGGEKLTVEFDLIDSFASVKSADGRCAPGLSNPFFNGSKGEFPNKEGGLQESPCGEPSFEGEAQGLPQTDDLADPCGEPSLEGGMQELGLVELTPECGKPPKEANQQSDEIQSERDRRYKRGSIRWRREKQRIARMKAKQARRTKEALHRWTTEIVRHAAELSVIAPPVKSLTKTGRGDEKFHGAEVATIAALNRHVLSMAPASAVQMLEYKAAEAGVACAVERREDHQIRVGVDLRAAAVATKRAKRVVKRKQKILEAAE